jgi:anaphase-promoting complex subunit 4
MSDTQDFEVRSRLLQTLVEKAVPHPVHRSTFCYCPTMDLLALATEEEQVLVYRLNGQRVFSVAHRGSGRKICQLEWKPDGMRAAFRGLD